MAMLIHVHTIYAYIWIAMSVLHSCDRDTMATETKYIYYQDHDRKSMLTTVLDQLISANKFHFTHSVTRDLTVS